uniref:Uncharacterized protein n=1 Tax=Arundo donax TaxID=35708 RepID=A0A0A8Z8N5_ARUDO
MFVVARAIRPNCLSPKPVQLGQSDIFWILFDDVAQYLISVAFNFSKRLINIHQQAATLLKGLNHS